MRRAGHVVARPLNCGVRRHSERCALFDVNTSAADNLYLFCYDYGTGGVWCYFRAQRADDVRRKYPTLTYVDKQPAWFTPEQRERLLATRCFDVDAPASSHPFLEALKRSADEYFASLGEQVLPPRNAAT
jgi:hypothetical protein